MIQGILWDNDGVLVDTEYLFYLANKELLNSYSLDLSESDYFDWYLKQDLGAWHLFHDIGISNAQIPELKKIRNTIYTQKLNEATQLANHGIELLLQELYQKVPMGVVTSAYKEHFDAIHSKLCLKGYFDFVLTSEDYKNSKPSPEPYLLGLNKLGLDAQDCVIIEDSPRGLQAALAANIRCIVLRNKVTATYNFQGAYKVVDSIGELHDTLLKML